jgi:hypothetical protein
LQRRDEPGHECDGDAGIPAPREGNQMIRSGPSGR